MKLDYRPEIDGLRAIAVLAVVFFHLKVKIFPGGYAGVDIFFVISGYLISRNILTEIAVGSFSFREFYRRRILRLFPALIFTIAVTFVLSCLWMPPDGLTLFAKTALASLTFVSNIYFWIDSHQYFAAESDNLSLLHLWSLSVEEQFYLFWPLVLWILAYCSRRILFVAIAGLVIGSFFAAQRWATIDPAASFYLMPFRVYQFGFGALVFFVENFFQRRILLQRLAHLTGLGLIIIAIGFYGPGSRFPSIGATAGAALIIVARDAGGISRFLANGGMLRIGVMSYSLYLCHWPIVVFLNYIFGELTNSSLDAAFAFLIMLVTANFMFRFVEQPFRKSQTRNSLRVAPFAFVIFLSVSVLFSALAVAVIAQNGWEWRLTEKQKEINRSQKYGLSPCRKSDENDCVFGQQDKPLGVVLIGDSYAEHYVAGFDVAAKSLGLRGAAYVHGGCLMLKGLLRINYERQAQCRAGNASGLELAHESDALVVISQAWMGYLEGAIGDGEGRMIRIASERERLKVLQGAIEDTVRYLGDRNRRILIIGAPPLATCNIESYRFGVGPFWHRPAATCPPLEIEVARRQTDGVNGMLRDVQSKFSQVTILFPVDYLCDKVCRYQNGDTWLYLDAGHLTVAGAEFVIQQASKIITPLLKSSARP